MGASQSRAPEDQQNDEAACEHEQAQADSSATASNAGARATLSYAENVAAKNAAQDAILKDAVTRSEAIVAKHANAQVGVQRGFLNEIHHEATFNCDAAQKGSAVRAVPVPGQAAADIHIVDGGKTVSEVQTKMSVRGDWLTERMSNPKYDGMQKVGNPDVGARGVSDRITDPTGKVHSDPLTVERGNSAVANPAAHFNEYRPNVAVEAAKAGLVGATVGAGAGAAVAAGATLITKGRLDREDLAMVAESSMVGAAAGGIGSAVTVAVGSSPVGAVAGGTVGVVYGVWKCRKHKVAMVQEAVTGGSSAAASLAVGAVTCVALGPLGLMASPFVVGSSIWAGIRGRSAASGLLHAYYPAVVVHNLVARVFARVVARAQQAEAQGKGGAEATVAT